MRARNRHGFIVGEGAGHYELYDEPRYVDPAVAELAGFFTETLTTAD